MNFIPFSRNESVNMAKLMIILAITVAIIPKAVPHQMNLNGNEDLISNNDRPDFNKIKNKNSTISLSQFSVFNKLGSGGFGSVFLAKKLGDFDDGKLFALKAINISRAIEKEAFFNEDFLTGERTILEAAREWPWATGLHYAWRQGKWLFLAMDFIPGGSVSDKIFNNPPAPQTTKIILAEIVIALEKLHRVNIVHGDLCFSNILVDSDGHLTLTDFGVSQLHSDNSATKKDWSDLSDMTCHLFPNPIHDDNERSVMKMLADLTDAQLFKLKSHHYFNGIDWNKVAKRNFTTPFEVLEIKIMLTDSINLVNILNIEDQLDAILAERFSSEFDLSY